MKGRAIVAGAAEGDALVTHEPLSFWGGFDLAIRVELEADAT